MSLSQAVQEHATQQAAAKRSSARLKQEATAAARTLADTLAASLNVGVAEVFANQKQLEAEAKQLHAALAKHTKAAGQWAQVVAKFNAALKEIGDVENWAERLEDDMHTIVDTLEYIHRGEVGTPGDDEGGAA